MTGTELKTLRTSSGLSQSQLGKLAAVGRQNLSRWELAGEKKLSPSMARLFELVFEKHQLVLATDKSLPDILQGEWARQPHSK